MTKGCSLFAFPVLVLSAAALTTAASCSGRTGIVDLEGGVGNPRDGGGSESSIPPDGPRAERPGAESGQPRCTSPLECQDMSACNGFELCVSGRCVPGPALRCDDGIACTSDQCMEPFGCVNQIDPSRCRPGERCDPGMGGCVDVAACRVSSQCDDGRVCNGRESCQRGRCVPGPPPRCFDGVGCTDDRCVDPVGCVFVPDPMLCGGGMCDPQRGCIMPPACRSDFSCDDGRVCNGREICNNGTCFPGKPPFCDDGNLCTSDFCAESAGGCLNTPVICLGGQMCDPGSGRCVAPPECTRDDQCNDRSFCNGQERCINNRCRPAAASPCFDGDECTLDACNEMADVCQNRPRDLDGDGAGDASCGGDDCDDSDSLVRPGVEEICDDGRDNDCDGLPDCAAKACVGHPVCLACRPDGGSPDGGASDGGAAPGEVCGNGVDDDCDTLADCDDPECDAAPECCSLQREICDNGRDDNCNMFRDCMDPGCARDPNCVTCKPGMEICANTIDDDCDGLTDCKDPKCGMNPACVCGVELCRDGADNDCDGKMDCNDPDCVGDPVCVPCSRELCRDGLDNDCDERVDCDDPECAGSILCQICLPFEYCGDRIDNDCNGLADCADQACANNPNCVPGCAAVETFCRDGRDNDCDGFRDCDDPDCAQQLACLLCLPIELPPLCQSAFDEDCDGRIDCDDRDCRQHPACLGK